MISPIQPLFVITDPAAPAAENMARDFLLLETFAEPHAPRLRLYDWEGQAWTFGYGQPWRAARAASGTEANLIRRPTGGGLVDHRNDWTYALVLPPAHPLSQARACDSYRAIHETLAEALRDAGCKVQVAGCKLPNKEKSVAAKLAVCFTQPERFDVVRADDGRKIAGAAQKRTRSGLLFQGSVNRLAAAEVKDWEGFGAAFSQKIAEALSARERTWDGAPWPAAALTQTAARFASLEWNQRR